MADCKTVSVSLSFIYVLALKKNEMFLSKELLVIKGKQKEKI
jgi:hypothetical protein